MGSLKKVQVADIRDNPVALRTVNQQSEAFLGLCDSIRQRGFMGAITARERTDGDGNKFYEVVDGLHRFTAARAVGLQEINVDIVSLSEAQVLEAQIMANIHKIETTPMQYTEQLKRILSMNPLMTETELATKLGKSPAWIKERLGLLRIENEQIRSLINDGKINLSNAYALAKLPPDEMPTFVDRAMTEPPDTFLPVVNARVKEVREARRKGQSAAPAGFQPVEFMRKLKEVRDARTTNDIANSLLSSLGITDPVAAFNLALSWILHVDPESVKEQKAKYDAREAEKSELKKRKKAEQARAALEEAEKTLASV